MDILSTLGMDRNVEVRHQECLDLLASLPDDSVDVIVTDPPYGISYQSNHRKGGKSAPIARDWNFQIAPFLEASSRVLKPGGAMYVFCRWDVYGLWCRHVPPSLSLKNLIIWVKDNHSAGDLDGNFGFKYEAIMFFVKGRHTLRGHRFPNVWEFSRLSSQQLTHPAEKPVALLQRAIMASSDEGGLVVDPFCGSGSTGDAATLLGRRALLGDIDIRYVRQARERLGLSTEDLPIVDTVKAVETDPRMDLSPLDGIHPEELLALAERFR